jgi:signal transduction histidine kinase
MPSAPARRAAVARRDVLRSVRARTTLVATAAVAVVLVVAVAGLASAVERTLTSRLQAKGAALVEAVIDRLRAGTTPPEALAGALRSTVPSGSAGDVPTYVAVLDREGHPVVGSGFFSMPGMMEDGEGVTTTGPPWGPPSVQVGSSDLTVAQRSVEVDGELLLVVAASPLVEVVRSVEAIIRISVVGVPLLVVLVGAVTWTAMGRTLRPIEQIRAQVEHLSAHTLDQRVPVPATDDEVARLADTMNSMLARLEAASMRQREFVSDASHELRSPVASIRTELEVALAHPTASSLEDVATGVLGETSRIERLVDDLLLLARIDEDAAPAAETVDVGRLIRQAAARLVNVAIDVHVADGVLVTGSEGELASVVRNLLDNAARHAVSSVVVAATTRDDTVVITVDDDGPGIPPADRKRIFERFARLERARSRADGGVGLGLAIVDRVVRHHNGSVEVADSPAAGASFRVMLPRRAEAPR